MLSCLLLLSQAASAPDLVSAQVDRAKRSQRPADFVDLSDEIRRLQEQEEATDEEVLLRAMNRA